MIGNVAVYTLTSEASVVDAARTSPEDRRANSCSPLAGRSWMVP